MRLYKCAENFEAALTPSQLSDGGSPLLSNSKNLVMWRKKTVNMAVPTAYGVTGFALITGVSLPPSREKFFIVHRRLSPRVAG